jgi:hypothetical protein
MLLDRRHAWERLEWKTQISVDMPGSCQAYELVGGVFAKTTTAHAGSGASKQFLASWLPSINDPGHKIENEDVGLWARDFAIDPTQDLIAYLVVNHDMYVTSFPFSFILYTNTALRRTGQVTEYKVHVHLRTISTNSTHPDAAIPVLECNTPFPITNAFIQIVHDIVGMFVCSGSPILMLWNWQTGELLAVRDYLNHFPFFSLFFLA